MQRIDLIIGAILLVAAVGSAIGVVTYQDDRVGTFGVTWLLAQSEATLGPLTRTGGGDVEGSISITTSNLTRAAWVVTLGGAPARVQPVAIRVDVISPTNVTASVEATLPAGATASVEIPLDVDLASVPTVSTARAPSVEAARDALNATQGSSLGVGVWTVRVSLSPSAPGPLGGTETFTATTTVTLTSYSAEIILETPEVARS